MGKKKMAALKGTVWPKTKYGKGHSGHVKRCWEDHKPMPIKVGDAVYYITGGSCGSTPPKGTDVFIGLDASTMKPTSMAYPWTNGIEFLYPITDMSAPSDVEGFKKLIAFIHEQILSGKKVHVGCIGGHGRTGTVLAALVAVMAGEKDAITYVRNNYCSKAVESHAQIEFLHKHFGIKKTSVGKEYGFFGGHPPYGGGHYTEGYYGSSQGKHSNGVGDLFDENEEVTLNPISGPLDIWAILDV